MKHLPFNFTGSQAICNGGDASAAIILDGGAKETQFTQLVHNISVKDFWEPIRLLAHSQYVGKFFKIVTFMSVSFQHAGLKLLLTVFTSSVSK
jgi:hypothetical protein